MVRNPLLYFRYLILISIILAGCNSTSLFVPTASPVPPTVDPNLVRLANGEWPPYNGSELSEGGCDSQVIKEAFALKGIKVEYGFFPWARSYNLSASGDWDGTLAWADTPDHRSEHYISAKPTTIQEFVFFYRSDRPFAWNTLNDLAGKTIGITTGYVYSDAFKEIQKQGTGTFIESSSDEANFKMLLAGRIDIFPMERRVGHYIMSSIFTPQEQTQIIDSPHAFSKFQTYLLLSRAIPQNEQRMILFDRGFKQLQESGRYDQILQACTH